MSQKRFDYLCLKNLTFHSQREPEPFENDFTNIKSDLKGKDSESESHLCQKLSHHSVPFAGLLIAFPIFLIVHPFERVIEF